MRPPQRIEPMLALLRKAWERYPDQRLGQLVGNAGRNPDTDGYRDPFNVEDDHMWAGLAKLVEGEYDPGPFGPWPDPRPPKGLG